jgi:hypothetical protein
MTGPVDGPLLLTHRVPVGETDDGSVKIRSDMAE